ncbi:hypothetical protein D3C85_1698830 [compost metagenome]
MLFCGPDVSIIDSVSVRGVLMPKLNVSVFVPSGSWFKYELLIVTVFPLTV